MADHITRTTQFRCEFDNRPRSWWDAPEQGGLWTEDRSIVEDEAEAHLALGAKNVHIVVRKTTIRLLECPPEDHGSSSKGEQR